MYLDILRYRQNVASEGNILFLREALEHNTNNLYMLKVYHSYTVQIVLL